MKYKTIFLWLFLISTIFCQQQLMSLEDAVMNAYENLYPKTPKNFSYFKDGKFSFFKNGENGKNYFLNLKNGVKKECIDKNSIKNIFAKNKIDTNGFAISSTIEWKNKNNFTMWYHDSLLSINIKKKLVKTLFINSDDYDRRYISPNKKHVVITRDNNLFLIEPSGKETQLTTDGTKNIIYGDNVHRREFGIGANDGLFWSPKSNRFAFYKKDQSMVKDYVYLKYNKYPMEAGVEKYPMAGQNNHVVKIGIYEIKTGEIKYLNTGEVDDVYLANLVWDNKGENLFFAKINRDQNYVEYLRYSLKEDWKQKLLFTESDDKWIDPENSITPLKSLKERFIFKSWQDGYFNLYLYDFNGNLIKKLTNNKYDITKIIGEVANTKSFYFQATGENFLERHIYELNLNTLKVKKITNIAGTWKMQLNKKNNFQILSLNSQTIPGKYFIYNGRNKLLKWFKAKTPKMAKNLPRAKFVALTSKDSCQLSGYLLTPQNMDKNKKYPVIVYVYGGPHSQLISNRWITVQPWLLYLSQKDYVIWVMDNHGTANRGKHFAQKIFRNCGKYELEDQLQGINYLKQLSFVDTTKIGVHGWSYGGFMTLTMMTKAPNVFKVGVSGAPVVDWKYYETVYTERYMDTPQTNEQGFMNSSILNSIKNLTGKLLVIHGTEDHTVVLQHTIQLLNKAIKNNSQMDYFLFPGHKHGIRGKDKLYLYNKMTNYFNRELLQ